MNTSYSRSTIWHNHNQLLIWLCVLSFFSVLNEMVLNVSLPDIADYFDKPPAITNWVNTAFMLTFSVGTAVYGKLSDQLGIAIVGGMLSISLLDRKLLPIAFDQATYLYSNMLMLFAAIVVMSWLVILSIYKRFQKNG